MPNKTVDDKFAILLAKRIVALRKIQNLSQVQVAELLGISQQAMTCYENYERKIPVNMLPPIAKILNCPVEELLGIGYKKQKRGPNSLFEERFEKVRRLPKTKQKEILNVVDALIAQAS